MRTLRDFHQAHGRSPAVRGWDQLGHRPSAPAIIRHYQSWNAALTAAGLTVTKTRRRWSDDEILAAIRAFQTTHGRPPARRRLPRPTLPSFETVRLRFGSLTASTARARHHSR